jgi:hypothetical protein
VTNLAETGVSPKVAQQLARHSDIRLTLDWYTHTHAPALQAAVNRLPALSGPVEQPAGGSVTDFVSIPAARAVLGKGFGLPVAAGGVGENGHFSGESEATGRAETDRDEI